MARSRVNTPFVSDTLYRVGHCSISRSSPFSRSFTTHGGLVATSARPSGLFKGSQCSPFSGGPRLSRPHWMSSRFLLSPIPEDQPLPSHLYKCEGSGESLQQVGWIARTEEEPVGVVEDVAVAQGSGAGIDTAHGVRLIICTHLIFWAPVEDSTHASALPPVRRPHRQTARADFPHTVFLLKVTFVIACLSSVRARVPKSGGPCAESSSSAANPATCQNDGDVEASDPEGKTRTPRNVAAAKPTSAAFTFQNVCQVGQVC